MSETQRFVYAAWLRFANPAQPNLPCWVSGCVVDHGEVQHLALNPTYGIAAVRCFVGWVEDRSCPKPNKLTMVRKRWVSGCGVDDDEMQHLALNRRSARHLAPTYRQDDKIVTMDYRRVYMKGGTYFFTLVTYNRRPILTSQESIALLDKAFYYVRSRMPFDIIACVILPDHLHMIWALPENSSDFSTRWRLFKSYFTRHMQKGKVDSQSKSRSIKGERDVWQRRFWEHLIRDESDLARHIEYIHYNPVKHGLVDSPGEWKHSTFHQYVEDGLYPKDWGRKNDIWVGAEYME